LRRVGMKPVAGRLEAQAEAVATSAGTFLQMRWRSGRVGGRLRVVGRGCSPFAADICVIGDGLGVGPSNGLRGCR
jgi:hypothetical protein